MATSWTPGMGARWVCRGTIGIGSPVLLVCHALLSLVSLGVLVAIVALVSLASSVALV